MAHKNLEKAKNITHKSEINSEKLPLKMARPCSPTCGSYPKSLSTARVKSKYFVVRKTFAMTVGLTRIGK